MLLSLLGSEFLYAASYNELPEDLRIRWEALLHYNRGESIISQGSSFFLNPYGNTAANLELESTLDLFEQDPESRCKFPARYYLLFGKLTDNYSECSEFEEYIQNINVEKISVVLASEDESSPVSSMGHVFMVIEGINSIGLNKRHSFGFVADTEGSGSLIFKFLTGSIVGRYTLTPYDDTIYNYISKEHRSLWEYELRLTEEERKILFLHLFELKTHGIGYSFFTNNCATGLNKVIAVANPEIAYDSGTDIITPVEYIKHINKLGLTDGITIRPSATDKVYLDEGLDLDPLRSPPTSRFKIGYIYNSYYSNGVSLDFLPLYSDIFEDSHYTSKINHIQFLRISADLFPGHSRISNLRIIDIHSLPDIRYEKFKINFGLDMHSDVNSKGSSLYPDLHLGSGISYSFHGIVPFAETEAGIHYEKGGANFYASLTGGIMFKNSSAGRISAYFKSYAATGGDYSGYKSMAAVNYSKQLSENLWLDLYSEKYFFKGKKNLYTVNAGLSVRF